MYKFILFVILSLFSFSNVYPIAKTVFEENGKIVDLTGKNFIVVEIQQNGSGKYYAVDQDGLCWATGLISSGGKNTPEGIYKILWKKEHHMSKKYPDPSGINNMDFSLFFSNAGLALHKGNVNRLSHGCVHVSAFDMKRLFKWATYKTKIVILRSPYLDYVRDDLMKIYGGYK
jgi:lipoprotein-anchoring transpeptidase ErfK/SrfK